ARGLCTLSTGECEGSRADGVDEAAVNVALAEPDARGESRHALAVHHAVGDQAHEAADEVGARVPLGRAWGGVRAAALAGPEAGGLGGRCVGEEAAVLALRGLGRAARAAVDAGGCDAGEEPAVEARVLGLAGLVAVFGVEVHANEIRRSRP